MTEFDRSMSKLYNEGLGSIDDSEELVKWEENAPDIPTEMRREEAGVQDPDKSLEELLGASDPELARDQPRMTAEESGSGMFRLSAMIANSSVQTARTPSVTPLGSGSIVPPPPSSTSVVPPPPTSSVTPPPPTSDIYSAAQPAMAAPQAQSYGTVEPFEIATTDMPSTTPLTLKRKSVAPIFAVIAAMIIAAVIGVFVFGQKWTGEDERLKQLAAQMDSMKKAARDKEALEESLLKAEIAKIKAGIVNTSADNIEIKEPSLSEKGAVEEEAVEDKEEAEGDEALDRQEEIEPATREKKRRRWSKKRRPRSRRGKAKSKVSSAATKGTALPAKQTGREELNDLLGSGKSAPTKKKKASSSSGRGKPTRADVMAAMGPVSRQAMSCSKFARGTVQLRVTVGSNGRVKKSRPVGSFSGTNAGKCVAMVAKGARFSPFGDPSFSFTYPVRLQ
ncbi:MAG: hypothetical protein GY854_07695 [Deltaproteobacteria bacterium]|nr:hypothetical protein [Deltaproteobacteria bacterium]